MVNELCESTGDKKMDLETKLKSAFDEMEIKDEQRDRIKTYLELLKQKDRETYEHSMRVGFLARDIGQYIHLDEKALFYSGVLHDVGKTLVDKNVLKKTSGFNEEDMKKIRKHPEYGYMILKGLNDFSAEIILRHHRYQDRDYPRVVPKSDERLSRKSRLLIEEFARIIALADFYDAASTRINDKYTEDKKALSGTEVKEMLLNKNRDQRNLIEDLYREGIFEENKKEREDVLKVQREIYQSLNWPERRNPREIRRDVELALALEPLSNKYGCTTRIRNCSRHLKLEYFISAGINSGGTFEDLAKRILDLKKQPEVIYDLLYMAQLEGMRNRIGGRINQGALEMLFPIVASQCIYNSDYNLDTDKVLENAVNIMKNTSRKDVDELIKMKRLAYNLSGYLDRDIPKYPDIKNVYDYYKKDLENSEKQTSRMHNAEFVEGFPTIKLIYNYIKNSREKTLNRSVEEAYKTARMERHKGTGYGLTADCVASGIYLMLSQNPRDQIIR